MLLMVIGGVIALQAIAVMIMAVNHMRDQNHNAAAALAFAAIVFLAPASAMAFYGAEDEAISTPKAVMAR